MNPQTRHRICGRRERVGSSTERPAAGGGLEALMQSQHKTIRDLAHDLRNPLNSILLMAQFLEESESPESARIASKILRQCDEMRGIMDRVLDTISD